MRSEEPGARSQRATTRDSQLAGYRRLIAWKKADLLASRSYGVSKALAREDRWIASQLRRAALSAPLNIVEGHSRGTIRDFLRFLEQANASLTEVESLISFIIENDILDTPDLRALVPLQHEASRVLIGLIKALRTKLQAGNEWQRNLLSEEAAEYITGGYEITGSNLAPGSWLLDAESELYTGGHYA